MVEAVLVDFLDQVFGILHVAFGLESLDDLVLEGGGFGAGGGGGVVG